MGIDEDIHDLYGLPPEAFTSARDELAKRLAADGDREASAGVKRLRKPSLVGWALNQLSRRHLTELQALMGAGEALRRAQRRAASGAKDSGFQEATERRRAAIMKLTARATALLAEVGKPTQSAEGDIGRTLEAASVDPEAGAQLLAGRLTKPISTVPGFDSVGAFEVIAGVGAEEAEGAEHSADRAALRNAERRARKAESDALRARMRAETLEEEAAQLRRRAEEALGEARRLEAEAAEARERLERSRREAEDS